MKKKLTQEQFDSINFDEMRAIIRAKVGFKLKIDVEFEDNKIEVRTSDLVTLVGIIKHALKTVTLCNFGGGLSESKGKEGKEYYLPLYFRFTHKDRGGTGADLCTLWWDFEAAMWLIKD